MRVVVAAVLCVACRAPAPHAVTLPVASAKPAPVKAAPAEPLVIDARLGGFGCRGWSPARHVAMCFVGSAGTDGPQVTAKMIAVDDAASAPDDVPVTLNDAFGNQLADATIAPESLAKIRAATAGFVTRWTEESGFSDTDGHAEVSGVAVDARSSQGDPGGENAAPRYHVDLVAGPPGKQQTIDTTDGAVSSYAVSVYLAGRTALVEREYSIADEGQYEQHADVFVVSPP